jgi:hypothetical protein
VPPSPCWWINRASPILGAPWNSSSFGPPRKYQTRITYYHFQSVFIWAILCSVYKPLTLHNREPLFSFNEHQANAARTLINLLNACLFDQSAVIQLMYDFLCTFYFSPISEVEDDINKHWSQPIAVFCTCLWINEKGTYRDIWDITVFLMKMQYSI